MVLRQNGVLARRRVQLWMQPTGLRALLARLYIHFNGPVNRYSGFCSGPFYGDDAFALATMRLASSEGRPPCQPRWTPMRVRIGSRLRLLPAMAWGGRGGGWMSCL